MAFIRERNEERTGYQDGAVFSSDIDFQNDFVMVYRLNDTTAQRIEGFRRNGYRVHLMTGISWGFFIDYLNGKYDGINHWHEAQTDRFGNNILHGVDVPYMVPSVAFADYLSEKLRIAVDAGVEAIHVEEPEFWDRGGYSEAFKREYELYYRTDWVPAYSSYDSRYKTAKLKSYLFKRTIDRVASSVKEYAKTKYGRNIGFFVPTHSLLNYTQWRIISPEGACADIPAVDGFIAQVWTGTSREKNIYNGVLAERTFDTAYLEYGIMQELVSGTDKKMWFLHDPIEDNPAYDWNDYRKNYLQTVAASLLHTKVNSYEICPWPHRVFQQSYPMGSPDAQLIPEEYETLLNGIFQTLGDMETANGAEHGAMGILMSDSALFQRDYPDSFYEAGEICEQVGTVLDDNISEINRLSAKAVSNKATEKDMRKLAVTKAFPQFYGLALPLIKNGLNVRPVSLDNTARYTGYLDSLEYLVLSYEFMKPESPDMNTAIASWVASGGTLIYVGDGSDPYHGISSWWSGKYRNAAEHLFKLMQIPVNTESGSFRYGDGFIYIMNENPSVFCFNADKAEAYRQLIKAALLNRGACWEYSDLLTATRGKYIVASVLGESEDKQSKHFNGLFADMFTPDFEIINRKTLQSGENTLLCDLSMTKKNKTSVIGTCLRIFSIEENCDSAVLTARGAAMSKANIRLYIPENIASVNASYENGEACPVEISFDKQSSTVLLSFKNKGGLLHITINFT